MTGPAICNGGMRLGEETGVPLFGSPFVDTVQYHHTRTRNYSAGNEIVWTNQSNNSGQHVEELLFCNIAAYHSKEKYAEDPTGPIVLIQGLRSNHDGYDLQKQWEVEFLPLGQQAGGTVSWCGAIRTFKGYALDGVDAFGISYACIQTIDLGPEPWNKVAYSYLVVEIRDHSDGSRIAAASMPGGLVSYGTDGGGTGPAQEPWAVCYNASDIVDIRPFGDGTRWLGSYSIQYSVPPAEPGPPLTGPACMTITGNYWEKEHEPVANNLGNNNFCLGVDDTYGTGARADASPPAAGSSLYIGGPHADDFDEVPWARIPSGSTRDFSGFISRHCGKIYGAPTAYEKTAGPGGPTKLGFGRYNYGSNVFHFLPAADAVAGYVVRDTWPGGDPNKDEGCGGCGTGGGYDPPPACCEPAGNDPFTNQLELQFGLPVDIGCDFDGEQIWEGKPMAECCPCGSEYNLTCWEVTYEIIYQRPCPDDCIVDFDINVCPKIAPTDLADHCRRCTWATGHPIINCHNAEGKILFNLPSDIDSYDWCMWIIIKVRTAKGCRATYLVEFGNACD